MGIGRIELLEHIAHFGSINQAAKQMGMSYKKAWKLIEELNGMYDQPLVVKVQGGKSGGGTQLTAKAERLIKCFRELEDDLQKFLMTASHALEEL
ncbi:winged helix-turn-helix domain-containing protein [Thiomicrorhabdus aquaedulcis]|uniref:winged helix-turn-helix domain-containing protein n=1 Tax=Thiomicrorhabdus aquaedulcis TaxID=2211106 RepID=UPI001E2E231E|nr:winged helix-turn-helix domain-containing protein [Thiomicrorhabdus aquaedulcis]